MSQPDNSPPTDAELRALAHDVSYEINMFWHLCRIAIPKSSGPEQDALKEAALIHARCLMAFFNSEPKMDDVVATHYVPEWDPDRDGGKELRWLKERLDTLINKRVAHLTAYRQRVPKESHLVDEILLKMMTVVKRFTAMVPSDLQRLLRGFADS